LHIHEHCIVSELSALHRELAQQGRYLDGSQLPNCCPSQSPSAKRSAVTVVNQCYCTSVALVGPFGTPAGSFIAHVALHKEMAPPATAVASAGPPSSSRKRKIADAADATAQQQENKQHLSIPELFPPPPVQNEYELQRQQRIERNRQIMQDLGVVEAAAAVRQSMNGNKRQRTASQKTVGHLNAAVMVTEAFACVHHACSTAAAPFMVQPGASNRSPDMQQSSLSRGI
jgi:hypothetical protein